MGVLVEQRRGAHRAGIGLRREARRLTWGFVRQRKLWLAGVGAIAFIAVLVLGVSFLEQELGPGPMPSWWTPFGLGLGLGALPCLVWGVVTSADGSHSWRIGAEAERWTAEELAGLGPAWRIEHDVPFRERFHDVDVDHVAVGPYGVLAVETKWTSHDLDLAAPHVPQEVQTAIRQAEGNAGRVRGLLDRARPGTDVIPVVVYWGPKVIPPDMPVRRVGDVRLVAGGHGSEWQSRLGLERLDPDDVDRMADRVRQYRIDYERSTVGHSVSSRLNTADQLGRLSIVVLVLAVGLLPLSGAPGPVPAVVDAMFRLGGGALAATLFLVPLVLALASAAFVWLARQLDPDVAWLPHLIPVGVWIAGFVGIVLATS